MAKFGTFQPAFDPAGPSAPGPEFTLVQNGSATTVQEHTGVIEWLGLSATMTKLYMNTDYDLVGSSVAYYLKRTLASAQIQEQQILWSGTWGNTGASKPSGWVIDWRNVASTGSSLTMPYGYYDGTVYINQGSLPITLSRCDAFDYFRWRWDAPNNGPIVEACENVSGQPGTWQTIISKATTPGWGPDALGANNHFDAAACKLLFQTFQNNNAGNNAELKNFNPAGSVISGGASPYYYLRRRRGD